MVHVVSFDNEIFDNERAHSEKEGATKATVNVPSQMQLSNGEPAFAPQSTDNKPLPSHSFDALTFNVIDHIKLRDGQLDCLDVAAHRKGQHAANLNMQDYEFSPNVTLFCDVSTGKKARPLVPAEFRELIIRMFHGISHPGQCA